MRVSLTLLVALLSLTLAAGTATAAMTRSAHCFASSWDCGGPIQKF